MDTILLHLKKYSAFIIIIVCCCSVPCIMGMEDVPTEGRKGIVRQRSNSDLPPLPPPRVSLKERSRSELVKSPPQRFLERSVSAEDLVRTSSPAERAALLREIERKEGTMLFPRARHDAAFLAHLQVEREKTT